MCTKDKDFLNCVYAMDDDSPVVRAVRREAHAATLDAEPSLYPERHIAWTFALEASGDDATPHEVESEIVTQLMAAAVAALRARNQPELVRFYRNWLDAIYRELHLSRYGVAATTGEETP